MNKEWVENKLKEEKIKAEKHREKIKSFISNAELISEKDKERFIKRLYKITPQSYASALSLDLLFYPSINIDDEKLQTWINNGGSIDEWERQVEELRVDDYCITLRCIESNLYNQYLDSEPTEFDGDIIITDPCYIMRVEHHGTTPVTDDDWDACDCGRNMEALGINTYMTKNTIYGDWSCTTFNTDSKEPIGRFCADAGLVSVFLLDEILKYNPDYDDHIKNKGVATWIKDFKGTVQFVVVRTEGVYEDTTDWHTAGSKWENYSVEVVGHGINKVTGEPINFVGKQTGF